MNDKINKYLNLPYTVTLKVDEDGDFVARIAELPGCSSHGKTHAEALENLRESQSLWIQDALEAGDAIPAPEDDDLLPSGKWVQRVPRTLHLKLARLAKRESVSLNQLVTSMLAESFAVRSIAASAARAYFPVYAPPALSELPGQPTPTAAGVDDAHRRTA